MKNQNLKIVLVYLLLCLIWGSTWIVIRIGLESLTPMISAGYRFTLASLIVLAIMKYKKLNLQTDKISIMLYLSMAFFSYAFPFSLVYWAESPQVGVPSGLSAVLFGAYPFFVAILSYFFLKSESIGISKISGMVLGFSGIFIIFSDSFIGDVSFYYLGVPAIVLSAFMQSGMLILIKKFGNHLNPLSMNFIPMLTAGIVLIITGFSVEDTSKFRYDFAAFSSVLYLALFGSTVTFSSYYWLLKRVNVIILSLIAFITPIVALLLGFLFYEEQLSSKHLLGTIMVLSGLLISNLGNLNKFNNLRSKKALSMLL